MGLHFQYLTEGTISKKFLEAGIDEAGRGCLAGPVVAAAVILMCPIPELNDSKKLTPKQRENLAEIIKKTATAYAIATSSEHEIDALNILNATLLAMHRSLSKLNPQPQHILVDGNTFRPYKTIPHTCIPQGDAQYQTIAAASILAKTFRDELIESLEPEASLYEWKKNKGYPTPTHKTLIKLHGLSRYHRKSFQIR
jgi:ribonuclease HII